MFDASTAKGRETASEESGAVGPIIAVGVAKSLMVISGGII